MSCPRETDVGAYLLDALEPGERLAVGEHLRRCATCSAVLEELAGLPQLLALGSGSGHPHAAVDSVDDAVAGAPGDAPAAIPTEEAFERFRRAALAGAPRPREPRDPAPAPQHAVRPPRSGRRRLGASRGGRWLLAAAAAVVVVVGAAGGTAAVLTSRPAAPDTVVASSAGVHLTARITSAGSGSRIAVSLQGVPSGQRCELTVQARDGHWQTASTWTADYEGTAHVAGTVAIAPADLTRLVVRTLDGRTLVTARP